MDSPAASPPSASRVAITVAGGATLHLSLERKAAASLADQIVETLSAGIRDGRAPRGTKLPSIRALARRLGLSPTTIAEAYDRLAALGLVEARPGSGVFVTGEVVLSVLEVDAPSGVQAPRDPAAFVEAFLGRTDAWIAPGNGALPRSWIDTLWRGPALARFRRLLSQHLVSECAPRGSLGLREQFAAKLARQGISVHPARELLVTHGSTQAVDLVLRTFSAPGETVLIEDPCYFMTAPMALAHGVRLHAIPRGPDGPDLAAVEEACRAFRPRLFLLQAVFHNPTGSSIAPHVLHKLLGLADRYDMTLVDEDVYGDFHPGHPIRPAQLGGLERVIYVASVTKVLGSGLRVGIAAASAARVDALLAARVRTVLTGSRMEEALVEEVLASGQYRRQVEQLWPRIAAARALATRRLAALGFGVPDLGDPSPLIWVTAPPGAPPERISELAQAEGALLAPGALFRPERAASPCLRFNAARSTEPRLYDLLAGVLARC